MVIVEMREEDITSIWPSLKFHILPL